MFNLGKKLNKLKIWNLKDRKKDLIEKGDCKVKHVFDNRDLVKAAYSKDLERKFQCLRCKEWVSVGAIINFVMKKEGINLGDKSALFDKYSDQFFPIDNKDNESKKDIK